MRTMYDSVTASDIPTNATMVAGYIDGAHKWSNSDWQRFPHATKVRIATNASTNDGHVLDVEPGAAKLSEAPGWVKKRQAAGIKRPTIYVQKSRLDDVKKALEGLKYALWVADWTGAPHKITGAAAVQYASPSSGAGGHYDLSAVYDDQWPR